MSDFSFGALGRFLCKGYRCFHPGWRVEGAQPDRACVYLVHHQNLAGPVYVEAFLPRSAHIWVLHVFLERRVCFQQYYGDTFTRRFGWPGVAAWPVAHVLSTMIPAMMRTLGAVPVYRGMRELKKTMDDSQRLLLDGESLLICPDLAYDSQTPELGEIYKGFLHLEKSYYRATGEHLPFVPLYVSLQKRRLIIGEQLCFTGELPWRQERDLLAKQLREAVNLLGRDCGEIT